MASCCIRQIVDLLHSVHLPLTHSHTHTAHKLSTPRVQAPVTLVPLHPRPAAGAKEPPHMHAAVMALDGLLYLIDGVSGCAHTVDIGEASYASVLVDDVDGSGNLDLVVATMNGNVYVLGTEAAYHPLKTWTAQVGVCNVSYFTACSSGSW